MSRCVLFVLATACTSAPPAFPWKLELSGCAELWADGRCEVEPGPLDVILYGPKDLEPHISVDGERAATSVFLDGAHRMTLQMTHAPALVELAVDDRGHTFHQRLTLLPLSAPEAISRANALRTQGKMSEAEAAIWPLLQNGDDDIRAQAQSVLARIRWAQDDFAGAVALYRQTLPAHYSHGRLLSASRDANSLTFTLIELIFDFRGAAEILEQTAWMRDTPMRGLWMTGQTQLQNRIFHPREALFWAQQAHADTKKLNTDGGVTDATIYLSLLRENGRWAEAKEVAWDIARDEPTRMSCQFWISELAFLAYTRQEAREQGEEDIGDWPNPHARFKTREAELATTCPSATYVAYFYSALAETELLDGDTRAALDDVRRARLTGAERGDNALETMATEADVFAALGRFDEAFSSYLRVEQAADALGFGNMLLRAGRHCASLYRRLGQTNAANAVYERILRSQEKSARLAPLVGGRLGFLVPFEQASVEWVSLLASTGHGKEAMAQFRHFRSTFLRSIQRVTSWQAAPQALRDSQFAVTREYAQLRNDMEKDAAEEWKLAATSKSEAARTRKEQQQRLDALVDEAFEKIPDTPKALRPRQPGELLLAFIRSTTGIIAIAQDESTQTQNIDLKNIDLEKGSSIAAPEVLGHALLDPFSAKLEKATRLRLLVHGRLQDIDFHALPWRGAPLIEHFPVAYGLDLGVRPQNSNASGAVVVGDPSGDLPGALAEAQSVARIFAPEATLLTGVAATRAALWPHLPLAKLFHYAGHGEISADAPFSTALPLNASRLSVEDLLFLDHAPALVVLSACDAGRAVGDHAAEGLGLAQAFLAAGSQAVIAPTRKVSDTAAEQLVAQLYGSAFDNDPAGALRHAQLALHYAAPAEDWAAFRISVP